MRSVLSLAVSTCALAKMVYDGPSFTNTGSECFFSTPKHRLKTPFSNFRDSENNIFEVQRIPIPLSVCVRPQENIYTVFSFVVVRRTSLTLTWKALSGFRVGGLQMDTNPQSGGLVFRIPCITECCCHEVCRTLHIYNANATDSIQPPTNMQVVAVATIAAVEHRVVGCKGLNSPPPLDTTKKKSLRQRPRQAQIRSVLPL